MQGGRRAGCEWDGARVGGGGCTHLAQGEVEAPIVLGEGEGVGEGRERGGRGGGGGRLVGVSGYVRCHRS